MQLMLRSGETKSGSPIWWRSSFCQTTFRRWSRIESSESVPRNFARMSCSWMLKRHVRIFPSAVRRRRLQCPQKGSLTGAMIHHIEGNRTHHYMLLLDGKPTHDKTCDGLAIPHGHQEEQYQLMTDKGPRVFMLFGQAK